MSQHKPMSSNTLDQSSEILSGLVLKLPLAKRIEAWVDHSEAQNAASSLRHSLSRLSGLEERLHYLNTEVQKLKK